MPPKSTYAVVSNPDPDEALPSLQVLFSGRSQTKPGHRLGPKVFDHFLIHYIESGRGTYAVEGREYALEAGDSFVIYPEALVSYAADEADPWQYRWIAFKGSDAAALVEAAGIAPDAPTVRTAADARVGRWFERVMRAFREGLQGVNLRANGCLQLLLAEYADARGAGEAPDAARAGAADGGPGAALVRQAIHYMTTQYAEPITIELMAESLGYNRAYLSRTFKERTGVSPIVFLSRLRLDRARRLLRERLELTVEQVASSVGFADALYFSKQFRRAYGETPTAYRARFRDGLKP